MPLAIGALVLAMTAAIDDRTGLSPGMRMAIHLAVAASVAAFGLRMDSLELPGIEWNLGKWPAGVISVLFLVWMVNLYNFMDGMDGFAGGMAVFGFGALAVLGWQAGHPTFSQLSAIIAAASAGFLVLNFPPARIFMGDVGSATLGFLAGALSIWGVQEAVFPFWVPILIFSPFVADATVTLIKRLVRGEKVWEAHRSHYYQRLVRLGWGHKKTVLFQYLLMLGCAVTAIWAVHGSAKQQWFAIIGWTAVYGLYFAAVPLLERRDQGRSIKTTKPTEP